MREGATIYIEGRNGRIYGPYIVGLNVDTLDNGNIVCVVTRDRSRSYTQRPSRGSWANDGLTARFFRGGLPSLGKRR
jgi:hypothetical protein